MMTPWKRKRTELCRILEYYGTFASSYSGSDDDSIAYKMSASENKVDKIKHHDYDENSIFESLASVEAPAVQSLVLSMDSSAMQSPSV